MKRSEINKSIRELEQLLGDNGFRLPPFCCWTPQDWQKKGHEYDEIRGCRLGWGITDYGLDNFEKVGTVWVTLRSGDPDGSRYVKAYAEKLLMLKEGQHLPMHFHRKRSEDIINRGGGTLIVHVYNDEDGEPGDGDVLVNSDGRSRYMPAGTGIRLHPGESVTIWPHQYHDLDVLPGSGNVLVGVISVCAGDGGESHFHENVDRPSQIEEDEEPYRLLCGEYPEAAE